MAAGRRVCVSEILQFLFKNNGYINDNCFINEASELFTDKLMFKARGNLKLDKLCELVDLVKYIFDNKLSELIPIYSVFNIDRVPIRLAKDSSKSISEHLMKLNKKLNKNYMAVSQLHNKLENISEKITGSNVKLLQTENYGSEFHELSSINDNKTIKEIPLNYKINDNKIIKKTPLNYKIINNSLKNNYNEFAKRKKDFPPRINRTISKLNDSGGKFKVKGVEKRAVVYLGNIWTCIKATVEEHFQRFDVKYISVFPVVKNQQLVRKMMMIVILHSEFVYFNKNLMYAADTTNIFYASKNIQSEIILIKNELKKFEECCHVCSKHFKFRQDGRFIRHGRKVRGSKCLGSLKKLPSAAVRKSLSGRVGNISMFKLGRSCCSIHEWSSVKNTGEVETTISVKINSRLDTFAKASIEEITRSVDEGQKDKKDRVRKPNPNALIKSKIEQDNNRAPNSTETLSALQAKHPAAPPDRKPSPDKKKLQVCQLHFSKFPKGTSGGREGFTPQHLRDLTRDKVETKEVVGAITFFVNLLLSSAWPPEVVPRFFERRLEALAKKDGAIIFRGRYHDDFWAKKHDE
ncbi:hypothetical protein HELRODRAFT_178067 [Helobdella robusta]|uniref:Uncharacterized protein n=1 Tax=Helobdella robusta TaxID=6412 RepID=T1FCP1_HELRO|nr:hypothetical protein HELRODRAFT_178067 [Helobdella robusta]ESN97623.1 hypothetical protein HELRODRAFT_178067 [Helobdella robusta]